MKADWRAAFALLRHMGYAWPLVLVPFLLSMAFATGAWWAVLKRLSWTVPGLSLLRVRLVSEAFVSALPGGAVVAEAMKPVWVHRRLGVPISEAAASGAILKGFSVQAEGIYLMLALAAAFPQWLAVQPTLGGPVLWLWQSLPAIALLLLLTGTLTLQALRGGMVINRLYSALVRIPVASMRAWLAKRHEAFVRVDGDFRRFFTLTPSRTMAAITALSVGQWMMEAVESFIIFRLLGAALTFPQALLIEALTSAIRCVLFFLPGGLGALELTTFLLLGLLGFGGAGETTAAFAFAKRSKDFFWIVTSLALHFVKRRHA